MPLDLSGQSERRGSGQSFGFIWTLDGRRLVRLEVFAHPTEALEAVGLQE